MSKHTQVELADHYTTDVIRQNIPLFCKAHQRYPCLFSTVEWYHQNEQSPLILTHWQETQRNPGHGLRQSQRCGRIEPVNGIPNNPLCTVVMLIAKNTRKYIWSSSRICSTFKVHHCLAFMYCSCLALIY